MKTPFTRRAEAFADALERSSSAITPGAVSAGVAPLVFLAERLAAVPQAPVAGMASPFRAQLMTQASAVPVPSATVSATAGTPAATPAPASPLPAVTSPLGSTAVSTLPAALTGTAAQLVAGALAMAVAVTGAGVAADRSLPGQPFYGLKRLVERAQGTLATSSVDQAKALSDQAAARLGELQRLLASGELDAQARAEVDRLVADLSMALHTTLDRIAVAGGTVSLDLIEALTTTWNTLAALVPELPADAQAAVLGLLSEVNNRLGALVDGASPVNRGDVTHSPAPAATPSVPLPTPDVSATTLPAPVPTGVPTAAPTPVPTGLPTPAMTPTTLPTTVPTTVPTTAPSTAPSPAERPILLPSLRPLAGLQIEVHLR